jgi:hypothetical protein
MATRTALLVSMLLLVAAAPGAQRRGQPPGPLPPGQSNDPFPRPIEATAGVIRVNVRELAVLPDIDGTAARMMNLEHVPGTGHVFVNDMRGPLYRVDEDGGDAALYLDIDAAAFGVGVQAQGRERGFQSFAFHPQFAQPGTPGFGKLYTYTDTTNQTPAPDFTTPNDGSSHDTVLLEWTATTPTGAAYDGGAPRELLRLRQPFPNHNAGHATFNPLASPGDADFGLLYVGVADGGSGGDPMRLAQNLGSPFGKILRIDPLGRNGANGRYGIPAGNPMTSREGALPEIYAYGVRNPQRLAWDRDTGNMFVADIGQNIVEEVSPVTAGANLGWNDWEGSYRFIGRQAVSLEQPRSDPAVTYPVAEYGQLDPLLQGSSAACGLVVYRGSRIPAIADLLLFTDNPSGELFYVRADDLPAGGQDPIRRVLLDAGSGATTMLGIIQEKNGEQGKPPARRADLRLVPGLDDRVFLLNKGDGTLRELAP